MILEICVQVTENDVKSEKKNCCWCWLQQQKKKKVIHTSFFKEENKYFFVKIKKNFGGLFFDENRKTKFIKKIS